MQRFSLKAGPILDDGAPYYSICEQEFHLLRSKLRENLTDMYEDLLADIAHRPYCRYGTNEHLSQPKKIIGSVLIDLESD